MNEVSSKINSQSFFKALHTVDHYGHLHRGISLVIVVLLHLWVARWLLQQVKPTLVPKPVIMEVSMFTPPKPIPVIQEPPPPPVKLPPVETPKPIVKPVIKPPVKIKKPVEPKPVAPKVLTQPKTPVVTKEDFTVPTMPEAMPEPIKSPPVVSAPIASAAKASNSSEGNGPSTSKTVSSGVVPLVRIPPKYPSRAMNRHLEGWVKIQFTITTTGEVENPSVVAAEPADIFDEAALDAISQWKFKEKVVNGKAVEQLAVQTLQFKLTN